MRIPSGYIRVGKVGEVKDPYWAGELRKSSLFLDLGVWAMFLCPVIA